MNIKEFENNFGKQKYCDYSDHWIIYFLVDSSGEIVYVGKTSSTRLGNRLRQHSITKEFTSYFVNTGPQTEKDAYKLEGAFISMLRPKYNQSNVLFSVKEMKYLCDWMVSKKGIGAVPIKAPWWLRALFWINMIGIVSMYVIFIAGGIISYLVEYYAITIFFSFFVTWITFETIKIIIRKQMKAAKA